MLPVSQNVNNYRLLKTGRHCSSQQTHWIHGNITLPVYIPQISCSYKTWKQRMVIRVTKSIDVNFFHVALSISFCHYFGSECPINMTTEHFLLSTHMQIFIIFPLLKTWKYIKKSQRGVELEPTVSDFESPWSTTYCTSVEVKKEHRVMVFMEADWCCHLVSVVVIRCVNGCSITFGVPEYRL